MKELEYIPNNTQLDLTDRVAIEIGLARKDSFTKIAEKLRKHPHTVAREIKYNRTHIPSAYPYGNDCKFYSSCHRTQLCGASEDACDYKCKQCKGFNCHLVCDKYESLECHLPDRPPYVCNTCYYKKNCKKNRYYYNARYADAAVKRRRSESRQGVRLSKEELNELTQLIRPLIRKGQPLTHIYAEHENELPVGLRTLYNYIDQGKIWGVANIDLRRKVAYKARRKHKGSIASSNSYYREGRTYDDLQKELGIKWIEEDIVEMDTVRGVREKGKTLLTMIFVKNTVMLLFLLPDHKSESVIRVFDYLESGLGTERFNRLFPVFLTDNGSEFKNVDAMELNSEMIYRTNVYYCDPMASWQKPHVEKNHEYIRYVLPKGKSLDCYEQEDITLLMNHINSTKRRGLGWKSPYELVEEDDEDMQALFELLKMHPIPADEVHLTPELFNK
jgi:IS30 family transposase